MLALAVLIGFFPGASPAPAPIAATVPVQAGGTIWGAYRRLGPARWWKDKDELREAFEVDTGELSTVADRQAAIAAIAPYVPALQNFALVRLEGLRVKLPPIDWASVAAQIDREHAAKVFAIEQRIEEEEHALMLLLIHG